MFDLKRKNSDNPKRKTTKQKLLKLNNRKI